MMDHMSSITWWLEIAMLAFAGGIAIGFGVSWLLLPHSRSQAEPGALSEWPPMLGASQAGTNFEKARLNHEKARFVAEQWRERWRRINEVADVLDREQGEGRGPRLQ